MSDNVSEGRAQRQSRGHHAQGGRTRQGFLRRTHRQVFDRLRRDTPRLLILILRLDHRDIPVLVTITAPTTAPVDRLPIYSGHIEVATAGETLRSSYLGAGKALKDAVG